MRSSDIPRRDTIDLREVLRALRRGLRWLPAGVAIGLVGALVVNQLAHRYESEATVVLRDQSEGAVGSFSLDMMDGLPSGIGEALALPGGFTSTSETEAAILAGRFLLRDVVDELGLQVRVLSPRGLAGGRVFSDIRMDELAPRGSYTLRRSGSGYDVRGSGSYRARVEPGGTLEIPGGRVTLAPGSDLPGRIRIQVRSRWETVDRIVRGGDVRVESAGGDLAEVQVRWTDGETAAAVANLLIERYLDERRSRMADLTGARLLMLGQVRDSLGAQVDSAAEALRRFHRAAGTFDPERLGDLERIAEFRARVDALEVEAQALDEVLRRLNEVEEVRTADLLAFPSFLQSPAINQILQRLQALRDHREQLLERRTPLDPDVQLVERNIRMQEEELVGLARSYRDGLERSLDEIEERLTDYRAELSDRPHVETETRLLDEELEVTGATYVAVQTQVVRFRLEAVGEGAGLRQVDFAVPPDRPRFPRQRLNLALGLLAGLAVGTVWAVTNGAITSRVTDPAQVRARLGLPVLDFGREAPLPKEMGEGTAVVVSVGDPSAAEEARLFLGERTGLPEDRLRVERPSRIRDGDHVLLAVRRGERSLGAAEELLPSLRAAGALPVAAVLVPGRRRR